MLRSIVKPPYIYAGLFLLQLFFNVTWLASIQREQHTLTTGENGIRIGGGGGGGRGPSHKIRNIIPCDCTTNGGNTNTDCDKRVNDAIQRLESLKTNLNLGQPVIMPPATTIPLTASSTSANKPFLIIGIPTMPRASVDYLSTTLASIERQLTRDPSDPMYQQIQVWVMNNAPSDAAHESFARNQAKYRDRSEFRFLSNDHLLVDPVGPDARDVGSADRPGFRVRKQSRDIARLMQVAKDASQYYMAMEDDFTICTNTFHIVTHAIRKSQHYQAVMKQDWVTLKFSYGFNGFAFKNNQDLQAFAEFLVTHQARRPPVSCSRERERERECNNNCQDARLFVFNPRFDAYT